ncbi:MAG: hypothetical protein ACLTYW_08300 [Collinsella sp.]
MGLSVEDGKRSFSRNGKGARRRCARGSAERAVLPDHLDMVKRAPVCAAPPSTTLACS